MTLDQGKQDPAVAQDDAAIVSGADRLVVEADRRLVRFYVRRPVRSQFRRHARLRGSIPGLRVGMRIVGRCRLGAYDLALALRAKELADGHAQQTVDQGHRDQDSEGRKYASGLRFSRQEAVHRRKHTDEEEKRYGEHVPVPRDEPFNAPRVTCGPGQTGAQKPGYIRSLCPDHSDLHEDVQNQ